MRRDAPLVLLVGHCLPDSFGLRRAVKKALARAEVTRVNSEDALRRRLPRADLLLVNRALDGRFTDVDGVAMIARLRGESAGSPARLMLVSDYPEAQRAAEEEGALPGVGKSDLRSRGSLERIASAAGATRPG